MNQIVASVSYRQPPHNDDKVDAPSMLELKKLQLLWGIRALRFSFSMKKLHPAKLGIGNFENDHLPFGWQKFLYSLFVNSSVFSAAAVACIDAVLDHRKAVQQQTFPKPLVGLLFLFGSGRQIEIDKYPQNPVFV